MSATSAACCLSHFSPAQPADLTATKLVRRIDLALDWTVQKRQFGFR